MGAMDTSPAPVGAPGGEGFLEFSDGCISITAPDTEGGRSIVETFQKASEAFDRVQPSICDTAIEAGWAITEDLIGGATMRVIEAEMEGRPLSPATAVAEAVEVLLEVGLDTVGLIRVAA